MKISVTFTGVSDLGRRISAVAQDFKDKRAIAKLGGLLAVRGVQRNFRTQRSIEGARWPPLKSRPGGTPLQNTRGRIPKGVTFIVTPSGFKVGAGSETKAFNAVHNYGSLKWLKSGKKKGIPQRQFMYLDKEARAEIVREIQSYVRRSLLR